MWPFPIRPKPRYRNAYCSFCRKSYHDVGPLVEGPNAAYICSECVLLALEIFEQEKRRRQSGIATDCRSAES
jgi:ATP-dependent Clp protease ATP-binding subunit ClpX